MNVTKTQIFGIVMMSALIGMMPSTVFAEEILPKIENTVEQFWQKYVQLPKVTPTAKMPKFTNIEDIYIPSTRPTAVHFKVTAVDYTGKDIDVLCEHISGHIFPVGRTKVHCIAVDKDNNEIRDKFIVTIGYQIVDIPDWFKDTTQFWLSDKITDDEYFTSISYLINNDIIVIPSSRLIHDNSDESITSWVVKTSEDWTNDRTGNHEFSIAISWLIENGFIKVTSHK